MRARPAPPAGPLFGKYKVIGLAGHAGTVIGGDDQGAYAVADPRSTTGFEAAAGKYRVTGFDEPAGTVIARSDSGQERLPLPTRAQYATNVETRTSLAGTTASSNGAAQRSRIGCGGPRQRPLVCRGSAPPRRKRQARRRDPCSRRHLAPAVHDARARRCSRSSTPSSQIDAEHDDWALQRAAATGKPFPFGLDGDSDSAWRERIGNAVPRDAAEAIAEVMGTTLLLAESGETFQLSSTPVWVRPVAIALTLPGSL
jgi:site-specific DNA-cytosine methylase